MKQSLSHNRNYYYPSFKLHILEEQVHIANLDECYTYLEEFKQTAFQKILEELNTDKDFELKIDTQNTPYNES